MWKDTIRQNIWQDQSFDTSSNCQSADNSMSVATGNWPHMDDEFYKTSPGTSWSSGGTLKLDTSDESVVWDDSPQTYFPLPAIGIQTPSTTHSVSFNPCQSYSNQPLIGYNTLNSVTNHSSNNDWLLCQSVNLPTGMIQKGFKSSHHGWGQTQWTTDLTEQETSKEPVKHQGSCFKPSKTFQEYSQPHKPEVNSSKQSIHEFHQAVPTYVPIATNNIRGRPGPRFRRVEEYQNIPSQRAPQLNVPHLRQAQRTPSAQYCSYVLPGSNDSFDLQETLSPSFVAGNQIWKDLEIPGVHSSLPHESYQPEYIPAPDVGYQQAPRAFEHSIALSAPSSPDVANNSVQTSSSRDKSRDDFLIRCKREGMSYKDIKIEGEFEEAESTLRGRYRTLTKRKEERVRKPEWSEADVAILKQTVARFITTSTRKCLTRSSSSESSTPKDQLLALNKVPWKKVAEHMATRGCYRYGNATVKKKYWEVMGLDD